MIFEIVKSAGIAHKSYFIGSNGTGAVMDPRRDCDIYIEIAEQNNMEIDYIFETHRNEDYTIGSLELKEIVGADIFHGKDINFAYGNYVSEGDKFQVGSLVLEVIETPGHTDESISIIVRDKDISDDVYMIFTGDSLFAGETGRCDLYDETKKRKNAEKMYLSLFKKILSLGDNVIVCPAHGSGSICGAEIREQELTTVGYEKKTNPILQKDKNKFIEAKVNEKLYTPHTLKKWKKTTKKVLLSYANFHT